MVFAALKGLIPGSDEQHAWVPEEPSTLCGIPVTDPPPQLRRFSSDTGRSCPTCLEAAWSDFRPVVKLGDMPASGHE
jgi:hypothetical protein